MARKVRAIVYGAGATGSDIARYMTQKGVEIVGAVGNEQNIGRDLGEVIGLDRKLNVRINDDPKEVLSKNEADIATVAVSTQMEDMFSHHKRCLEAGLNVLSISEEALYPWTTSPELAAKLDRVAKTNDVTITGTGYQDIFWVNIITMLTGASLEIDSIQGKGRFDIDDYGEAVANHYFVNQSKTEVENVIEAGEAPPSLFRMNIEAQISELQLSLTGVDETVEPIVAEEDIYCEALDTTVSAGDVIGLSHIVEVETAQEINFVAEDIGKVYKPGEVDINEWHLEGIPDIHLENEDTPTMVGTSTQVVNRIPDVINHEPGFITVDQLPAPRYKHQSLENYVN